VGDIDFEVISVTENSNKFQKTRFWKEKSVENMVTLRPMAQATLDASDCVLSLFGKLLRKRGAWVWFHGIWTCGAKVLEY